MHLACQMFACHCVNKGPKNEGKKKMYFQSKGLVNLNSKLWQFGYIGFKSSISLLIDTMLKYANSNYKIKSIWKCETLVNYQWWKHPENIETCCAKSMSSCSEAAIAISLSRRVLSVRPPRQYLKTVESETGVLLFDMLWEIEIVASLLSESEEELSVSTWSSGLLPKLVPYALSPY